MRFWPVALLAAVVIGFLCSQSALSSVLAAQPPITWDDLPFVFFGCLVGIVFVVGMQLLRQEAKFSRWALRFFIPTAMWWTASGVGAVILEAVRDSITPASLFLVSSGAGMIFGLGLCWFLFSRKFALAL